MNTWIAVPNIKFTLTQKQINENEYIQNYFEDQNNPTEKEIKDYFDNVINSYAESNDGSELLANAKIVITCEDDSKPIPAVDYYE